MKEQLKNIQEKWSKTEWEVFYKLSAIVKKRERLQQIEDVIKENYKKQISNEKAS